MGSFCILNISIKDFCNKLNNEPFYIYGTGFVAGRFYESLRNKNLVGNLKGFITTEILQKEFKGHNIKCISDISKKKDVLICIAVHESNESDIRKILNASGFKNVVWIYPLLFDLWYGKPIEKSVLVSTRELLLPCINDYRIPARILAIENYYGNNDVGYLVYKKSMAVHSSDETAEKRLEQFIKLITSWKESGYAPESKLKIDEDYEIFDGVHRLALAYYHSQPEVNCDIYSTKGKETYINDEIKLTEDVIEKIDFSEDERNALYACFSQLQRDIQ